MSTRHNKLKHRLTLEKESNQGINVISVLQEAGHIMYTVVLIFPHVQRLHLMYDEVVWVLVSSGT